MATKSKHRFDDEPKNERLIDELCDELNGDMDRALALMRKHLFQKHGINAVLIVSSFDPLTGYTISSHRSIGDVFSLSSAARKFSRGMESD